MNILVITLNAWNVTNSTGNTMSNLFSELSDADEIANIYCRDEAIDNTICEHYFKITENDIIRNVFTPNQCGKIVQKEESSRNLKLNILTKGSKVGATIYRHRSTTLMLLREMIWALPVWKNKKLKNFLSEFSPDCIYMHGHHNLYMHKLLQFCACETNAKTVLYWGDDMYGRKSMIPLNYLYESMLRRAFRKSISNASLLFGGSIKLCEEYTGIFKKPFIPFFKECKKVQYDKEKKTGNPITIVYAGNLLYGREKMMVELVKALYRINSKNLIRQYQLKIFSNTSPTQESLQYLNKEKVCDFMGRKPYSEVCEAMDNADLALFIESFRKKDTLSTRLSFSTKIIDCMQSTAGILAIGPKEIASIEYIAKSDIGIVISSLSEIDTILEDVANHPDIIQEKNKVKVKFAKEFHTNTSARALDEIRKIF